MTLDEIKRLNRDANELSWLAQEIIYRIVDGKALTPKLATTAKEALIRLRVLTQGDYRMVIEDLDRLITGHTPRGAAWDATIDQMESVLQWTQNSPMTPRVVRRAV